MPTKVWKKQPAQRVYETFDRPKQTYFTPQNRTILNKNLSLSTPTSRQQTLTQIDFVSRLPDESEDLDLEYIQEEAPRAKRKRKTLQASIDQDDDATYEEPVPRRRKTRKRTPAAIEKDNDTTHAPDQVSPVWLRQKPVSKAVPATKAKTRTTKRTVKHAMYSLQGEYKENFNIYETLPTSPPAQSHRSSESMMPPPRTPRTAVKTEIPSSQSPSNTPLSMHSRRSTRNYSRSPLKEKSNNRRMIKPLHTNGEKGVRGTPKLEVRDTFEGNISSPVEEKAVPQIPKLVIRDTFETGSEGSDLSTITQICKHDTTSQLQAIATGSIFPVSDTLSVNTPSEHIQPYAGSIRETPIPTFETDQRDGSIGSESQLSGGEHYETQYGGDDFDIGIDTQAALDNAPSLPSDVSSQPQRVPNIVEDFNNAIRAAANGFTAPLKPIARIVTSYPVTTGHRPTSKTTILTPHTPLSKQREINHPHPSTTQVPRTPPSHLSDSEQASAQLTADLLRQTQRSVGPAPELPSQSKGSSWPSSTPILIEDDDNPPAIRESNRLLKFDSPHISSSASRLPNQRASVSFSQATTVDATQSSPHPSYTQVPSSPPAPALPHHKAAVLTKLPVAEPYAVPTVISSSPVESAAEPSSPSEPLWDGKPLTDSQLLPDSLMEMTVPRPPWGSSQESWVEE